MGFLLHSPHSLFEVPAAVHKRHGFLEESSILPAPDARHIRAQIGFQPFAKADAA
jgi:hypothetical protein